MKSISVLIAIAASLVCALPAAAADVTLHWSEIAPSVKGVKATVVLVNGEHVKGLIAEVQPDSLVMDPNRSVPRATVAQVRIRRNRIKGRVIGTTVGAIIGGLGAADSDFGSAGARTAAALVYIIGGHLIGYACDRHEVVINIAPDVSQTNFEQ
jgi:uncharacterized membrane protein